MQTIDNSPEMFAAAIGPEIPQRCQRCGSFDPRCLALQPQMTGRRYTWPRGATCADVIGEGTMQTIDNSPEMFAAAMDPEIPAQRWHVGSNIVGYLPEGDVYCFEGSEQDAQIAAREEAIHAIECDGDCKLPDDAHSDSLNLDGSGDYYLDENDCGYLGPLALHVWYAACDSPAECAAAD